jgi:hypothetical protein
MTYQLTVDDVADLMEGDVLLVGTKGKITVQSTHPWIVFSSIPILSMTNKDRYEFVCALLRWGVMVERQLVPPPNCQEVPGSRRLFLPLGSYYWHKWNHCWVPLNEQGHKALDGIAYAIPKINPAYELQTERRSYGTTIDVTGIIPPDTKVEVKVLDESET